MLKTLIFDLGKVIVPFDLQRGFAAIAKHGGASIEEIAEKIRGTDLLRRFESGEIEPRAFVEAMNKYLDVNPGYDEFATAWSSIFLPEPLIPDEFLEALHQRYRLLLLSNTNAIHFEMIVETYPILRHFDEFILSYKVGAMKPAPAIYRAALAQAQCAPEECFFTDDIADYAEAARREGIDAVQFRGFEQLKLDLRARGVEA